MKYLKNIKPRTVDTVHTHTHTHTSNLKNSRGITLIALIITIIVLLVLAGATLAMISGDNGILKKVVQAKESTQKASVEERIKLAIQSALSSDYNEYGKITQETLTQELEKNGLSEENIEAIEDGKCVFSEGDIKYVIYSDGKLEVKSKEYAFLPKVFTKLEYIESTGTQYIDTKYMINENFKYKIKFSITDTRTSSEIWPMLMGSYGTSNASDGKNYSIGYSPSTKLLARSATGGEEQYELNEIKIIERTISKLKVNGREYITNKEWKGPPANNVFIFNVYSSNLGVSQDFAAKARVYSAEIYDGNTLVRNFIPCKCTEKVINVDNVQCLAGTVGMYDLVEEKFYTNKGTGTFTPGPEVN